MTTRERLENKLERREEWAEKANARAAAEFETARQITEHIPFGQPILVGHHSESAHRHAIERSAGHMDKGCEEYRKAEYHESKARGLERQLANTIFSDDDDAVERIEAKIAEKTADQERYKAVNKIIRSKTTADEKVAQLIALGMNEAGAKERVEKNAQIPTWAMTNNNSEIRRLKQRLVSIKTRNERRAAAENSENGITITPHSGSAYIEVTFAEKPDWNIIHDLKTAGFYWRQGSWHGPQAALPESVKEIAGLTA